MWLDLYPRETELLLRPAPPNAGGDLIRQIQPSVKVVGDEADISRSQVAQARQLVGWARGLSEQQLKALLAACDRMGY